MFLKKGTEMEYIQRHHTIWPELLTLLKEKGISDYSIFLEEGTGILFASYTISNPAVHSTLSSHELMKKWWLYMKDLMETNSDNSPRVVALKEVFNLK